MRLGIKKIIAVVVVGLLVSSCQSTNKIGPAPAAPTKMRVSALSRMEEDALRKKVKNWEELHFENADLSLDTILRLTEDYLQARDILHKEEMEDYEEKLDFYTKGQISTMPKMPVQDYTVLVKRFNIIKERFQFSKTADTIYYILGYALSEQGKRDEGVKAFEEIIKNYPQSEYWMEVNFRVGEFYFETGQMAEAEEAYSRILSFPQSVFYEKALYKLGWAYYKLNDFKKAIDTFLLIADSKQGDKPGEGGLAEEALFCTAQSMSRFTDTAEAVKYLGSKGIKSYTPIILTKLADFFSEDGRYEMALPVLTYLAESFPDLPSRPFIYEKTAFIYDRMGNEKQADIARKGLIQNHNPNAEWYRKNCTGTDCGKIDELVSKTIVRDLKAQHLRGKKEDSINTLNDVITGCRQFISYYPKSQDLKVVNLLLAETLFDAKLYTEAVKEYDRAAQIYPNGPERGEIAYYSVLTYEILFLKAEDGKEKIPDSAKQVVETYKADLIESGKLDKALFKIADMYAQNGSYGTARDIISPLTEGSNPVPAYQKMAEFYLSEKNLAAAEDLYSRIVGMSSEPAVKEELARIRYDMAEGKFKEEKYKEAAAMFDRAFNTYPKSKVGEASLLKQGSLYIKTGNLNKIKDVAKRMLETFPESVNTISLLVESGYALGKEDPKEAAKFYEDALTIIATLTKTGKVSLDARKLILSASELYENSGNFSKVEQLLTRYLEIVKPGLEEEAEIRLKLANAQFMMKKRERGIENLNKVIGMEGNISAGQIAKAKLMLAKDKQELYLAVKLSQPFEQTLQQKTGLLEDLLNDYTQINKYKELQPETFFQIGVAFENFRDSILRAERPADLSKDELAEYNFLLEEKAYPYEEQAVKAYETSLKVGRALKNFHKWIESSITRLAVLRPALYKREFLKEKKVGLFLMEPEPATTGDSL